MDGLRFECQRGCTKCCETKGYVYITDDDLARISTYLKMKPEEFTVRFVYKTKHLRRLRKPGNGEQCRFLKDGGCSIHAVKPVQCRLYPFWPELVEYRDLWNDEATRCPGIGKGKLVQIGTALEVAEEMKTAYPGVYGD
ncbi:MAG: YkgJ family cysteine cluster protein [Acidobacteria bacterium]|nr:YkgJ family cysteine cluster protein [Acidobacteriota bacterium]